MGMYETEAFGKSTPEGKFQKIKIKRGQTGPDDIEFEIKYCGICHTDVHIADDTSGRTKFPLVPGHELAGLVTKVGQNVTGFKIGDKIGVGCMVESCLDCNPCKDDDEVGCVKGLIQTYNGDLTNAKMISTDSGYTYGGYSGRISVNKHFAIKVPQSYPLDSAGPIFCAGITMYTPLKQFGTLNGGKRVGIIGIGGLGQMGVRLAKAMGNEVTAISRTNAKETAAREIGADNFVVSTDSASMAKAAKSLDVILNTICAPHDANLYLPLLARKGTLVQLGLSYEPQSIAQVPLMVSQIGIAGSAIGGIKDTQDCINFCDKHKLIPTTEKVTWDQLDQVYDTLRKSNDKVIRYVLDMDKSLNRK